MGNSMSSTSLETRLLLPQPTMRLILTLAVILVVKVYKHVHSLTYRIAGFCHENFNVASHRICNIKIRYIFLSRDFLSCEIV